MKLLVTGGAGYCGSVTAAALIEAGHELVVVDNLSSGQLAAVPREAEFIQADLCDAEAVARLFRQQRGIDGILHFAANALVGESMRWPLKYLRDNLLAASNLLEQALAQDVGRFVLSSTASMFSAPSDRPIPPEAPVSPGAPYAESKYFIERSLYWLHQIYGLKYACLRYFNAAGATAERGESLRPARRFIPIVLETAAGLRESLTIYGDDYPTPDGTCVRDYLHVRDLADAHLLAVERLDTLGARTYHLGSGVGFSNREVIAVAERVTGRAIPYTLGPRRPGDAPVLVAAPEAARAELGWAPKHSTLVEIIESAWAWQEAQGCGHLEGALR